MYTFVTPMYQLNSENLWFKTSRNFPRYEFLENFLTMFRSSLNLITTIMTSCQPYRPKLPLGLLRIHDISLKEITLF